MMKTQNDLMPQPENSGKSAAGRKGLKLPSLKPSVVDMSQPNPEGRGLFISIYKAKGDWEFIAQYPVSAFKSCEITTFQHRKQSPALPTLLLELKPDSMSEKQRKRRSSRTGGLSSSKDSFSNTLLFRSVSEERFNIYDWQLHVKPLLNPGLEEEGPLSPISPLFASFTNPFANRESRRPSTSANRPEMPLRSSTQNSNTFGYSTANRERPSAMISPSPSLRSRRSDLSSQASSQQPPLGFTSAHPQTFTATLPSDLPSPASTNGYDNQLIEGWTSA
jgi:hypothetical protein